MVNISRISRHPSDRRLRLQVLPQARCVRLRVGPRHFVRPERDEVVHLIARHLIDGKARHLNALQQAPLRILFRFRTRGQHQPAGERVDGFFE